MATTQHRQRFSSGGLVPSATGWAISQSKERRIRSLLIEGQCLSQIAASVEVDRKTVRAIRDGRAVRRKSRRTTSDRQFAEVQPYTCLRCSAAAGRRVIATYLPCVACEARRLRTERMANARDDRQ